MVPGKATAFHLDGDPVGSWCDHRRSIPRNRRDRGWIFRPNVWKRANSSRGRSLLWPERLPETIFAQGTCDLNQSDNRQVLWCLWTAIFHSIRIGNCQLVGVVIYYHHLLIPKNSKLNQLQFNWIQLKFFFFKSDDASDLKKYIIIWRQFIMIN